MRVALIQPPMDSDYPPLSLGSLAAYLAAKGHEPRIFDLQVPAQRAAWPGSLAEFEPRLVGVTAMTPTIAAAAEVGRACKQAAPDATLVLGGYHVSFLPEETMRRYPAFDLGVVGEGEVTLAELCDRLEASQSPEGIAGLVWRTDCRLKSEIGNLRSEIALGPPRERIRDLDSLPWPHEHYDLDHYLWYGGYTGRWTFKCASAIVSRGCPFRCRFCASQRFWSHRYLVVSPERVVDEMRWLARHGARSVYFRDSTFNVNRKWLREFCAAKGRAGVKMRWLCNSRVDTLDEEQLALMAEAGLEALYFGVESGSQRILDYYGKGVTVEQTREAFRLCHRHGVATAAYFMIGAPIETRADIEESRKLAYELRAKYTYWFIYTPLPGAPLYDDFIERGYKPDFEHFVFSRATIPVGDLAPEELEALHHELVAEFRRKATRGEVWRRRWEILRSVRSWRDVRHLGRKLARRIGLGGRGQVEG
ncbi:MAG: radical SAM protein [Planctomycetes bacterium]|nr:radical SAM protein [Planctomycetota bacterium]